jgi:hypothetical protein
VLLLLGILIAPSQGSAVAPFTYTLLWEPVSLGNKLDCSTPNLHPFKGGRETAQVAAWRLAIAGLRHRYRACIQSRVPARFVHDLSRSDKITSPMKSPARVMMSPASTCYRILSRILVISAHLLLIAGCESGDDSSQAPSMARAQPGYQAIAPLDPARPPEMVQPGSGDNALPDGALEIEISDNGVAITANEVSEQKILYTLAARTGFEVIDAGVPWKVVTLTIKAGNLHAALVELLKQYPYQIIYEFDANRQGDTLKRVVAGDTIAGREIINSTSAPDVRVTADTRDYAMRPGATESVLSVQDQINLTLLLDPSPEVRERAATNIEPNGIALDYLTTMVTTDPSPVVRMAAALTLEDSDDPKALDALVLALQDNDPRVLEAVIDALGDVGNRSTIPYLQHFLDHPVEDVRDAAESSIDDLK